MTLRPGAVERDRRSRWHAVVVDADDRDRRRLATSRSLARRSLHRAVAVEMVGRDVEQDADASD